MRGRRRGLGLGNYTLGDRYITPDRRLSQMLMRQGSRGGPSDSWQETLGRIAQQLSGAYIGKLDQDKQDIANQTFAKVEPDSFRPPTDAEAMATPGMRDLELSAMTGIAGDGRGPTVTAPLPDDQLMQQGGIPGTLDKISRYNAGLSGDSNRSTDDIMGAQALNAGIDLQAQNFQDEMEQRRAASTVPRPRDFKAELAQGMQNYQQDPSNRVMNEKMPQIEYAMQNLRGLENNPYAQRLLQGLMMNKMSNDAASRLDATARERQLADAQSGRNFTTSERLAGEEFKRGESAKSNLSAENVAIGKRAFGNEDNLREEFNKGAGDFLKVRDAYGRIKASAKDPSPAGDLALIFNYMKVLDPGSTVREGEFATAQNSASIPDRIRAKYNQIMRGERLALVQRDDFVDRAESLYNQQENFYKGHEKRYRDLATAYQLNPDRVVQGLNQGFIVDAPLETGDAPPEIIEIPQTGDQKELDALRKWKAGQPK